MVNKVETSLPVLYEKIDVLDRVRHKSLRLKSEVRYRFASSATIVPIVNAEFRQISKYMPIVFVRKGSEVVTQGVLGLADGKNAFVLEDGSWKSGSYIPAYIRRYPFLLVKDKDRNLIGFESEAKVLSNLEGEKLFGFNGEMLPAVERIREFCLAFEASWALSVKFSSELDSAGVLVPAIARISGSQPMAIDGFEMVDQEKLLELPAEKLKSWQKKGWLDYIHAHHASLENWSAILPKGT